MRIHPKTTALRLPAGTRYRRIRKVARQLPALCLGGGFISTFLP